MKTILGIVSFWVFLISFIFSYMKGPSLLPQYAVIIQNGDFETGDLNGWTTTGDVTVIGSGTDANTGHQLQNIAEGQYSAVIGNAEPWYGSAQQQSGLEQVIIIPPDAPQDIVLQFTYAVVANDPPNHPEPDKPRFRVLVEDLDTQNVLSDTNYVYTDQTSPEWYLGDGMVGPLDQQPFHSANLDRWVFKPWAEVQVPLHGLNGHRLRILFDVRDCNWGAHPIYGLLDQVRIGSPSPLIIPSLVGIPTQATYITPPFWAGMTQWLEQMGLIWLCCLLPLLFLLGFLLWLFLNQRSRPMPRTPSGFGGGYTPKARVPKNIGGGGASPK